MAHKLPVVGLTGGIASGKSTVGKWLKNEGVPVIDADLLAREVVELGEPALAEIAEVFGREVIQPSGHLDRQALGQRVFSDRKELECLNAIMHPAIKSRAQSLVDNYAQSGASWVVYEAALIIENALSPDLAALVVVMCDPETQITRLMQRNDLSRAEAKMRVDAQTTNEVRRQQADYLVLNEGDLETLRQQVDRLILDLQSRFRA